MEFDLQLFGPAAVWAIPAAVGLFGSISGNNQAKAQQSAASDAANQATAGQNAIDQQMMSIYNNMSDEYKKMYAPLLGDIAKQYGSLDKTAAADQTSTYSNSIDKLINDPTNSYALGHFMNESKQGMDPAIKEYALNQIRRQGQSSIDNLGHSLGSSIPNVSGLAGDIAEKSLEAQVDASSRMATQDQGLRDQATLQANSLGNENIQNMLKAYGLSSSVLDTSNNFINQGKAQLPGAASGMGGIASQYERAGQGAAGQAAGAAGRMTNPFSTLGQYMSNNPFPGFGGNKSNTATQPAYSYGGYKPGDYVDQGSFGPS